MGFSVPLADWLRSEIRPAVESAFYNDDAGLAQFFDITAVRKIWQRHLGGENRFTQELWSMLAFELWWQSYGIEGKGGITG
jgi:asparagine synthase (glutamine-hydrolysing)